MKIQSFKSILLPFMLGLSVFISALFGLWQGVELNMYDNYFKLRGIKSPGEDVVIIAMDEKSIGELGALPWPRKYHANLLDYLGQAKAVGFDLLFDTPSRLEDDNALAHAIKRHGRVILASMFRFEQRENGEWLQQLCIPCEQMIKNARGTGFVNLPADKGNIVRKTTLVDTNTFGPEKPIPSFSLAVTMLAENIGMDQLEIEGNNVRLGNVSFPINSANQMWIDFYGPSRTFPTYSYVDVLKGKISPEKFKDKIVLIGLYTPTVKEDYYENPFTEGNLVLAGKLPVPGVEIHASAIKTYLDHSCFTPASFGVNLAIILLAGLLTFWLTYRRPPWLGLLSTVLIIAAIFSASYLLWEHMHYWIYSASPAAMAAASYLGITVQGFIMSEIERQKTVAMFSRYVSPALVKEILKMDDLKLGGEKREVTIMFADIRGFTAYSENRDPEEVISRLNEYLTVMTRSILAHGGTLDKYLGDGLMAFFGAPVPMPDHAGEAVKTAIEIEEKIAELNEKWAKKGGEPLLIAIGINSGQVVVGNVGSKERMDYTVIGEDVNLASRMEALSKLFKTLIVISERSYNLVKDESLKEKLYYLGEEKVKGFSKPVACYSVKNLDISFIPASDPGFKNSQKTVSSYYLGG